jgi:hypothetical protein
LLVTAVFALQVAAVFWLGGRSLPAAANPSWVPIVRPTFEGGGSEWLALNDPTLFVLPHREGFSGEAWITTLPEVPRPVWAGTNSFRPWESPPKDLGSAFREYMRTNVFSSPDLLAGPEPELVLPAVLSEPPLVTESTLSISGELAERPLMNPPAVPGWTNATLLTNTVVEVAVDAAGVPQAAALLPPGSGNPKADEFALVAARGLRFEPIRARRRGAAEKMSTSLSFGTVIFQWATLPGTNSPVNSP